MVSFCSVHLTLEENACSRAGLMSSLSFHCSDCSESTPLETSAKVINRGKSFDVNQRAVYHSIGTGSGYERLSSFCGIMTMPCMSKAAYYKQVEQILVAIPGGTHANHSFSLKDRKRLQKADGQATAKETPRATASASSLRGGLAGDGRSHI